MSCIERAFFLEIFGNFWNFWKIIDLFFFIFGIFGIFWNFWKIIDFFFERLEFFGKIRKNLKNLIFF
jgi:hypothetical protein